MADKQSFAEYASAQVQQIMKKWSLNEGRGFSLWYALEALNLDEEVAYEAVSYDGGNDKDIDLFHVDDEHERIIICQGKFNKKGRYRADKNELLGLVHSIDWLGDEAAVRRLGRPEMLSASADYADRVGRGYSVEFHYVYMGPEHVDSRDQAALYNSGAVGEYPPRMALVVDLLTLEGIHDENIGVATRIAEGTIDLLQAKYFPQDGAYGTALVATIPARELRRLYSEHRDKLFARNVRLFLGTRVGGVNAGIRATLADKSERGNFWAYNNGITVVCDKFDLDESQPSVKLHNFSIVNGCQTTVSIANADDKTGDLVDVLARFIAAPERLVDNIIYYTNSQTPIKGWQLRAQDKIQKRLQREAAEEPNPWYYALRPGEQRTMSARERATYTRDGKLQSILYDKCAQYLAACRGLPYVAYKDKGKIFSTYYDSVFPQDLSIVELLLAWRVGEVADHAAKRALVDAIGRGNDIEVAILKRGGKIFASWVMSYLLKMRNGGTYLEKLGREVATSKKTTERLGVYAQVAVPWYVRATRQMVGTGGLVELPSILRTQDSFADLRDTVSELWKVQSIDQNWVKALPAM